MALEGLPPWVSVSPRDFVLAAAQGAQLGHQIADSTMRAWEEQARMRMASQEASARREQAAYQHEVETAANRLAADRLEQYRQSEIANRQAELGLRGKELTSSQDRMDEQERHNLANEKARQDEENRRLNLPRQAGGRLWKITPDGAIPLTPEPDTDAKDYRKQLTSAQAALDVAKRNVDKFSATKPSISGGIPLIGPLIGMGPTTNQVPVFPKAKAEQAKAALDAAQDLVDQKKAIMDQYKKSKSTSGVVTHVYDPAGDTYNPVQPDPDLGD